MRWYIAPMATPTRVTFSHRGEVPHIDQGRALYRRRPRRGAPCGRVGNEVNGRDARKQPKHAVGWAEIATPYTLPATVDKTDRERRQGRTAQDQQRRFRIFIDTHQLAINRSEDERKKRPTSPTQPFGDLASESVPTGEFRQRAFRAKHTAPHTSEQHHAQHHERPPNSPKQELREQGQMIPDVRVGWW